MGDLIKQMKSTLVFGVIAAGSSHHEYYVAEQQFRRAIREIEFLTAKLEKTEAALLDLWSIETEEMGRRIIRDLHPKTFKTIKEITG